MSGHKKDPSPEFLSFAIAQLEILPSPARREGVAVRNVSKLQIRVGAGLRDIKTNKIIIDRAIAGC